MRNKIYLCVYDQGLNKKAFHEESLLQVSLTLIMYEFDHVACSLESGRREWVQTFARTASPRSIQHVVFFALNSSDKSLREDIHVEGKGVGRRDGIGEKRDTRKE